MERDNDQIEILVDEAHEIFNKTSIFEVADLDIGSAKEFLNEAYDNPGPELVERYLDVLEKIRIVTVPV